MAHPLSGANPTSLAAVVARAGMPSNALKAASIFGAVFARQPFSLAERMMIESRLPRLDDMPAPIFLLGHWRSGTTHLYNTLVKSEAFGFVPPVATGLPWDLFGIGKTFAPLLERALPEHRYIDNIPVTPDSPQEDEIAIANMSELSFYHGIYFPSAFSEFLNRGLFFDGCTPKEIEQWKERFVYLMRKLTKLFDGRPMMIKNPVYTGRFALLQEMFPDAKFIHIHRNPYDVFVSMQNFYKKLLAEFALQDYSHVDVDETILHVYDRMMRAFEEDAKTVKPENFVELRYDDLDQDAMGAMQDIYTRLDLPGFETAAPKFQAYLATIKSFEKNKFTYSDETAEKVESHLGYFIEKWGYQRPGAIT
ncbi:MAG: sulfotransferase [Pseudomonadota bacterium]